MYRVSKRQFIIYHRNDCIDPIDSIDPVDPIVLIDPIDPIDVFWEFSKTLQMLVE
mgnify:CR=1 FL=1